MRDLIVNLVAGVIIAVASVLITKYTIWRKYRKRYGHLRRLVAASSEVQIVLPRFSVSEFTVQGSQSVAKIPANIWVMPMAEGSAVAELVSALRNAGASYVRLVTQDSFNERDSGLVISIGGPSVNSLSAQILKHYMSDFEIQYPEHFATFKGKRYDSNRVSDGTITDDYGFMCHVPATSDRCTKIVLCGIWASGTQIATRHLINAGRKSQLDHAFKKRQKIFAISYAQVSGFAPHGVEQVQVYKY